MNKHAIWYMHWPEIIGFVVLILGFFVALSLQSAFMSYITVLLCGMIFGRLWHGVERTSKFSWLIVIFGFLIGFVLGDYYGDRRIIILLFVIGIIVSYWLHNEGYIESLQY